MKKFIAVCLAAVLYTIVFVECDAQVRSASGKIRVVYSAIGASQATVWIPYEAGIFRKHGLDVELLYVGGGSLAAQVLLSGEVAVGIFSGGTVISSGLGGGDLVIIAGGVDVIPFFLVARPELKRLEDLKGKKIGITRFGSTTDFGLRFAASKGGLNVERDFAVLQLGGQPEMMAGLTSGRVDAAMLNAEFTILARRAGFRALVDMAVDGPPFPTGTLNTSRAFIRNNEDAVRRLVRAYVEGIHYAKTHRDFSIGVLKKYMKNDDTAYLGEIYELYLQHFIPKAPVPSAEAIRTVLRQLGEKDPKARAATPQQFMEPRFMQELESDGFIQQLWR